MHNYGSNGMNMSPGRKKPLKINRRDDMNFQSTALPGVETKELKLKKETKRES